MEHKHVVLVGAYGIAQLSDERFESLFGVMMILVLVATLMFVSGLLATLGPVRRALRIQPMDALREE